MAAEELLQYEDYIKTCILPAVDKEMKVFDSKMHLPIEYIIKKHKKSRNRKFCEIIHLMCLKEYKFHGYECQMKGSKPNRFGIIFCLSGIPYKLQVKSSTVINVQSKGILKHMKELEIPKESKKQLLMLYALTKKLHLPWRKKKKLIKKRKSSDTGKKKKDMASDSRKKMKIMTSKSNNPSKNTRNIKTNSKRREIVC